jgi:hypothetical protein
MNFFSLPCMPHAPSIPSYCTRLPKTISSRKRKNIPIPYFGAASFTPLSINALSKLHHFLIFALILGLNALWLVDVYTLNPLFLKGMLFCTYIVSIYVQFFRIATESASSKCWGQQKERPVVPTTTVHSNTATQELEAWKQKHTGSPPQPSLNPPNVKCVIDKQWQRKSRVANSREKSNPVWMISK